MTEQEIDRIYRLSDEKISDVSMVKKRYCYDRVSWRDRLISVKGPRGVGKTTLLLQKIVDSGAERRDTLYLSLDSIWLDPKRGDFLVDDKWLFEVGGKGKSFDQIKDVPDSFVVNDGVESTRGNKIPLWLFGFLY